MLVLPSGRVIDITTDRAKYHALQHPGISPGASSRQLYALVDIVYRYRDKEGNIQRGWTEYDYEFSGYTLESVRFASDWSSMDKSELQRWLRLKEQQLRVATARRRLHDEQKYLSSREYSAPRYLYSLLEKRLKHLPLKRATASHWHATIEKLKQKGLREEEILWSGLYRYLEQFNKNDFIAKKQLLKVLDKKNLRIELSIEQLWGNEGGLSFKEVAFLMPHQAVYRASLKLDDDCLCLLRYIDNGCNYRIGVVKTLDKKHSMALNKYWFALDPYGRAITNAHTATHNPLFFDNSIDAKFAANEHARKEYGMSRGVKNNTRFDHLTLYGGKDYREWFISLPDYQRTYFGPHFFDHNVLAHVRTTTRTDLIGRKILFIEEVQSDWHQSAKRSGYNNSYWGKVANAPFKKEWTALAVKLMLIHASQNGFDGIAWPQGNIQELRYKRQLHSIKQYYDTKIPGALKQLGKVLNYQIETTQISTREPWLMLEKSQDKWRVADQQGKFSTRAKYNNREEALAVIMRHCKEIDLDVSALFISDELRHQINESGLPLYGHTLK